MISFHLTLLLSPEGTHTNSFLTTVMELGSIFFAEHIVAPWNSLPPDSDFSSLNKFKRFIRTVDFSTFLCVEV